MPRHSVSVSGLDMFVLARAHVEATGHPIQAMVDHATDSFGFRCEQCFDTWRIPKSEWATWLGQVPFEHAQLIRFFGRAPWLSEFMSNKSRSLLDLLPDPPQELPEEAPAKSAYARLLEDDES